MRRRNTGRGREVPRELVDWGRSHTIPGEEKALRARFAGRPPGVDLLADIARAGGVEVVDLAASLGTDTTAETASPSTLAAALPRARQRGAQRRWLDRHLPPEQHEQALMLMVREELFVTYP